MLSLGHDDREDGYPPAKLVGLIAVDRDGTVRPLSPEDSTSAPFWSIPADPGLTMLAVSYRGGQSGQRADGRWVEGPRGTDPEVLRVGRYDKSLLAILSPEADPTKAPPTRLQLRPAVNPLTLSRGDRLRVQLLLDGEPVPGIPIMADYAGNADIRHATTDAAGWAEITVQNQGLNVIAAMLVEPAAGDPEIDFVENLATLSFALRPRSHQPGYLHPAMTAGSVRPPEVSRGAPSLKRGHELGH